MKNLVELTKNLNLTVCLKGWWADEQENMCPLSHLAVDLGMDKEKLISRALAMKDTTQERKKFNRWINSFFKKHGISAAQIKFFTAVFDNLEHRMYISIPVKSAIKFASYIADKYWNINSTKTLDVNTEYSAWQRSIS